MGILQLYDTFFEKVERDLSPQPGHIYWVPTPDVKEVITIFDVERATPNEHQITSFCIEEISSKHFTSRERLPIKNLNLGDTEELVITKAKKRPVVIIAATSVNDIDSLPEGQQKRLAKHLGKITYIVAPLYSTSTMSIPGTFGPSLVARIRGLQYLHLFCLPDKNGSDQPSSIIRLDRIFITHLGRGCKSKGEKLHDEPFEILLSQFSILTGGGYKEPFELAKELAQSALPDLD